MNSVLIVDDQSTSRLILEELVASVAPDLDIHAFGNPFDALAWAQANRPDLILTDYKMPQMDGVELITELRGLPNCVDVPIIVITIVHDIDVRYRALEAGATDLLLKPIDHHECRARCRNLLTMRKQAQIIKNRARWLEKQVADATRLVRSRESESLEILAHAAEQREDPTGVRIFRIGHFSKLIAARLGMNHEQCETIQWAAMLHDVGKITIPDRILLKPGQLDTDEFECVKLHALAGWHLLKDRHSAYLQLGAEIALAHHERYDGRGYPNGLRAEAIPLSARIAAVADVYDALTSVRPYKNPVSMERAVEHLNRHKGTVFDPACIEAFNSQLDRVAAYDQQHQALQDVD